MHITNTNHAENLSTLLGQLFDSTPIPVCLWFLTKNKNAGAKPGFRDRRKAVLSSSNTLTPTLDQQPGRIDLWYN